MKTHDRIEPIGWKSCAEWAPEVYHDEYGKHVSTDTHGSEREARGVCNLLHLHGFGGDHEHFPIRTWIEPIYPDQPSTQPAGQEVEG